MTGYACPSGTRHMRVEERPAPTLTLLQRAVLCERSVPSRGTHRAEAMYLVGRDLVHVAEHAVVQWRVVPGVRDTEFAVTP